MKKIDYKKPNMCVVEIQQRHFLAGSDPEGGGQQVSSPGSSVREYRGDEGSTSSGGSVWDKEW